MKLITPFFLLFCFSASGKFYINVGAAKIKESSIVIAPFITQSRSHTSRKMYKHLSKNLKVSGYFKILPSSAFIENLKQVSSTPFPKDPKGFKWENWKQIGADFLIFNHYSVSQKNLKIKTFFYNINLRKKVFVKSYISPTHYQKDIINQISNDIVKSLTKKKGIFKTKIASVRTTSGTKKELFVMNWDGSSKERLTFHRSVVMSPAWSPKGNKIAYTAFVFNRKLKRRIAALFLYHRNKKFTQLISSHRGANLGADFYPNGKSMLITLTKGIGNMDIFKLDLNRFSIQSFTRGLEGTINVDPVIHPKNKLIAFSSDRKKRKAMIYTMDSRGKNIKQITFAGHYNSEPTWSPISNELIFSGQSKGRVDLFKIKSDGSNLKRLTSFKKANGKWANFESPSFSPDGRFIVFSSNLSGNYQLYIMNLETRSIERITFDRYNYKKPRWSPYL